jgi:hypothetical protein
MRAPLPLCGSGAWGGITRARCGRSARGSRAGPLDAAQRLATGAVLAARHGLGADTAARACRDLGRRTEERAARELLDLVRPLGAAEEAVHEALEDLADHGDLLCKAFIDRNDDPCRGRKNGASFYVSS